MIRISTASLQDASALKMLLEAAYRGDAARQGWTHEADILDDERIAFTELKAMLADPAVTILMARSGAASDQGLIGCVAITCKSDALGYLGMLCVRPDLQSAGLGRRLLNAAEDCALAQGISAIEMTVIDSRHELISWYERRGYARTGETRPFPVLRDPPISFAVLEKQLSSA